MEEALRNIAKYSISYLKKNLQHRKIVIWGSGEFGIDICDLLLKEDLNIYMFVDSNTKKLGLSFKNIEVKSPNILINNKDQFYVIVAAEYYESIEEFLDRYGYKEILDYMYILHKPVKVEKCKNYTDKYGNKINGELGNLIVNFIGWGNEVTIGKNCIFGKGSEIISSNSSSVMIEADCTFQDKALIVSTDNSNVVIKKNAIFGEKVDVRAVYKSNVVLGENCSVGDYSLIEANFKGETIISNDCMISRYVAILTNDGHPIFDVVTKQQTNVKSFVYIGEHVWVGIKASILTKSKIGSGSIVGANSVVKTVFPNNCIVAGIPAKIVKRDIAWDRGNVDLDLIKDRCYWNITR